jgi:hypothetical protein
MIKYGNANEEYVKDGKIVITKGKKNSTDGNSEKKAVEEISELEEFLLGDRK